MSNTETLGEDCPGLSCKLLLLAEANLPKLEAIIGPGPWEVPAYVSEKFGEAGRLCLGSYALDTTVLGYPLWRWIKLGG